MKRLPIADNRCALRKALSDPFKSPSDVYAGIKKVWKGEVSGLQQAVGTVLPTEGEFVSVMEGVRMLAVEGALPHEDYLEVMDEVPEGETEISVSYSRLEARTLLSMSFFGAVPSVPIKDFQCRWGEISWFGLFASPDSVSVARLECLLHYFKTTSDPKWLEESVIKQPITFYRVRVDPSAVPWSTDALKLPDVEFSSSNRIEDFTCAGSHVDFANKNLQIHRIIPSATQEEVLFSIRPELMLCIFMYSTLKAEEAAVFTGASQYCEYSGYLSTFEFEGGVQPEANPPVVLGIDAIAAPGLQYKTGFINRDLGKAYAGFLHGVLKGPNPVISTGNWGCGAFGGDVTLKFLQQLVAAAHAGCPKICYSTFMNPKLEARLGMLNSVIKEKGLTSADLYKAMLDYKGQTNTNLGPEVLAYNLPKSGFEGYAGARIAGW